MHWRDARDFQIIFIILQSLHFIMAKGNRFGSRAIMFDMRCSNQMKFSLLHGQKNNWGEPERAPHKHEVRVVGLSVVLSVRS